MPTDPYTLRERLIETLDTEFGNWQWDSVAPEMSAGRYVADALLPLITQTVAAEIEKVADDFVSLNFYEYDDGAVGHYLQRHAARHVENRIRARAKTIREEGLTA